MDLEGTYDSDDDDDYLLDELRESARRHSPHNSLREDVHLGQSKNGPQQALPKRLQMQKRIDDAKAALVAEALTKGVELEGNALYYEVLDYYPYYQKVLRTRKQAISRLRQLSKMQDPKDGRRAKYKFEEKYLGPKGSSSSEIMTTTAEDSEEH